MSPESRGPSPRSNPSGEVVALWISKESRPPPEPPRISAVEHRLCQPRDLLCHVEFVNDQLEAMSRLRSTSSQVCAIASGGQVRDLEAHMGGEGWAIADLERVPKAARQRSR